MDKSTKKLISAGAGFLFLACVLLGFLMLSDLDDAQIKNVKMEPTKGRSMQAVVAPLPSVQEQARGSESKSIASNAGEAVPAPASAAVTQEPSDPISEILGRTDEGIPTTVNQLLSALPKLNPEQQAEAAQHIANLSDDTLAAQWAQKMIAQSLPQSASEVLFNDLLNRPHEMLLPILSKLADMPKHPQNTQSVEILDVLFGQPPVGSNWGKWVKMKAQEVP